MLSNVCAQTLVRLNIGLISGDRPSCVNEGSNVNVHITAPAALMALGLSPLSQFAFVVAFSLIIIRQSPLLTQTALMYMKTNSLPLLHRLALPQSKAALESLARPDQLLTRVWARALIGWRWVLPCRRWLWSQVRSFAVVFSLYIFCG